MMANTTLARAARNIRGLVGLLIAAMAFVAAAPSASAAGGPLEPGRYRTAMQSAIASSIACDEAGTCTDTSIDVMRGSEGTQVCVQVASLLADGTSSTSYEYGCTNTPDSAFAVGKKLASATLAPSTVTINTLECEKEIGCTVVSSRDVNVAASWTGTGVLLTQKAGSSHDNGTCSYKFKGVAQSRDANASITLDGRTLSGAGSLVDAKSAYVVKCN